MKKEQLTHSRNGLFQLRTVTWLPEERPIRAVLQLVHGIAEHIDRYDAFATYLSEQGYAVVGCDLPGHGGSIWNPDEYGYFAEEQGWILVCQALRDLSDQIKQDFEGLPYFLFGHSMGSFLVRTLMIDYPGLADGFLLSGTGQPDARLLTGGKRVTELAVRLMGAKARSKRIQRLFMGAYNQQFAPVRTTSDWISRDPKVVDRYVSDPLCTFVPTVSLFRDLVGGLDYIGKEAQIAKMDKTAPIYLFSGDQDPVGENGAKPRKLFHAFLDAGCQNVRFKLYPEGRHEMLNESNWEEVFSDIKTWLDKQLEKHNGIS